MFNFNSATGGGAASNTGGNLFGTPTPSTGAPSTSLFGSAANTSAAASGGNIFGGGTSTSTAPSGGSIFGSGANASAAPAGGSLFGNAASTSVASSSGGLFGGASSTSAAPSSSGLFGNVASTSVAPSSGGLFGNAANTSAAPSSGSMFGSTGNTSTAPSFGSMFGGGTSTSAAPSGGSMFGGGTNTSAAPSSGGMFGNTIKTSGTGTSGNMFGGATSTYAAESRGGTFGSIGNTSGTAAAAAAEGATITRKTRFVDLPTSVQQQLAAVEKQKHVQMQIGSSIMADETEREVSEVGQAVQRLAQDLQVAKMTLAADCERVEEAKRHVTFAIKHAEKGASLIAHATDDGSWAQSGLTPLQVANRQKALQSRLADPATTSSAPLLFNSTEREGGDGPLAVDAFEAVRRIQVASMHYDVASEYYWAWLTRVESSAQLLAERLDQLERHVGGAIAQQQSTNVDTEPSAHNASKLSPKAVSDIIQYQNDSFLAIAGKVAALDEDVRKLSRKLALKDSVKCHSVALTV
ncbi:hypothetical protein COEREDRAFT_83653 [Coemansia reversa NRRL 1564]|uniref:Nucleoporin Nup54 alpha-helical domain-containing protein n=1 Tax=Coemansia reversa (strain ATCC 12441 / NRRL 1564) TaxID=763665 RepID=A0A2G5B2D6_COERN|nr:hypothetical protein COEREDRAFT_83653 [Coemansia reversa NRRL 1564]|eukprot:PIA13183.1 hypothetical protein COEREDRAFT_83653 [Coemansia reversa NRRL 1564]